MESKELNKFKTELLEKKASLEASINRMTKEISAPDSTNSEEYSDQFAEKFRLTAARASQQTLLNQTNVALKRIATSPDEFGLCSECGCDINIKRLQALPFTTLCVECQDEGERQKKLGC